MHEEHRKRVKARFLSEGLDSFEEHNILELLLFYSIPRVDTNETAHLLIDRFGSFSGVLDAPYEQLVRVDGIKEHSVTLIKLIPALARRYVGEAAKPDTKRMADIDTIGRYFVGKYVGVTAETVYLLLLDNKYSFIDCIKIHTGSVNSSSVSVRKLAETALLKQASMAVLAHNHPGGVPIPSSDDLFTTQQVSRVFSSLDIKLLAHILVAGDTYTDILK